MTQRTLERPIARTADTPPNGKPADVLVRLWERAEQALLVRRQPNPAPRRAPRAAPARVRYAYD